MKTLKSARDKSVGFDVVRCRSADKQKLTPPAQTFPKALAPVVNTDVQNGKADCAAELEKNDSQINIWLPSRYKKKLQRAAARDDREPGAMARVIIKRWLDAEDK